MTEYVALAVGLLWLAVHVTPGLRAAVGRLAARLDSDEEPTPIEEVHQQYLDGEIDERELDRRLEVLVDDRAATVRDMADDVDGIGEELSRDLAREFDSVADLQGADVDELQRADGIGEKRAERLRDEL